MLQGALSACTHHCRHYTIMMPHMTPYCLLSAVGHLGRAQSIYWI